MFQGRYFRGRNGDSFQDTDGLLPIRNGTGSRAVRGTIGCAKGANIVHLVICVWIAFPLTDSVQDPLECKPERWQELGLNYMKAHQYEVTS